MASNLVVEPTCRLQNPFDSDLKHRAVCDSEESDSKRTNLQQQVECMRQSIIETNRSENRKRKSQINADKSRSCRLRERHRHKKVGLSCHKQSNIELVSGSSTQNNEAVDGQAEISVAYCNQQCARLSGIIGTNEEENINNQASRILKSRGQMRSEQSIPTGSEVHHNEKAHATSEKLCQLHSRQSFSLNNLQNATKTFKEAIMKTALFSRAALLISIYISITFTAIQATNTYQQQQQQQQQQLQQHHQSNHYMAPPMSHWPVSLPFVETQTGFNQASMALAMKPSPIERQATGSALQETAESALHLWPAAWAAIVRHRQRQQTNRRRQRQQVAQQKQEQERQAPQELKTAQQQQQQKPRLMIGQHYSNFSSTVPYSVIQDNDYGPMQEDPTVDELTPTGVATNVSSSLASDPFAASKQTAAEPYDSPFASHNELQRLNLLQQQQQVSSIIPHLQQQQQVASSPTTTSGLSMSRNADRSTGDLVSANGDTTSPTQTTKTKQSANERALLPLDSTRLMLPQMQQIKSRFNQGCVGGTKCQFFAFCWMSGGSLGASCGLLMTCCVTPSRQEIQPGFYGPVVNDPYCGRSTSKINRIVGGTDASFGQFPWQAFVQVGGSRCGGALISSRHVVTAGHCVARSQHSPASIKVTLGDYILNSEIESIPHEVYSVVEVLLHPNFRFTPQADRYDVAVLELDRQASYKDNIKPICLPQKDATFVGRVAYVAGWGALQAGSKLRPKVLQHVAVPVIENHVCESWHRRKGIDIRIYDEMMCAGYELGQRDACQGDSGGPLMLNQFGVWYLVGIVSAGYSCAKQYQPGIYHRVSSSSDWISSNVYQQGATS